jgi:hypothetical protein
LDSETSLSTSSNQKNVQFIRGRDNPVKPLRQETIISKNANSAFLSSNQEDLLDDAGISKLIIVGLTTFKNGPEIKEAFRIINIPKEYRKILNS